MTGIDELQIARSKQQQVALGSTKKHISKNLAQGKIKMRKPHRHHSKAQRTLIPHIPKERYCADGTHRLGAEKMALWIRALAVKARGPEFKSLALM